MIYKPRKEPYLLSILEILNRRMALSKTDRQLYYNLKKGYEGEVRFDGFIVKAEIDCLILNDLLLKVNNQTFQIDSLLITNHAIHFFEIKNYSGDFYYENNHFYHKGGAEISNPLIQMERTKSLLRQLLLQLDISIPVHASIIFINPDFTMYQAPLDKPFIFSSQLNRLQSKLIFTHLKLNKIHKHVAKQLLDCHINENPYQQIPNYNFTQLHKGMTCTICHSFNNVVKGLKFICGECGHIERIDLAIVRCTKEFQLLFPGETITTHKIAEWCKVHSKKTVQRVLESHFTMVGKKRWVYYV